MTRRLAITLLLGWVVSACGETDTTLKVTDLEPAKGDVEGGTYVRLKGNRFTADGPRSAKVYFGSHQGTVVRFASDRELIVAAPGGKPGDTVDVKVIFEPGGQLTIPKAFTYVDRSQDAVTVDDLDISKVKQK